MLIKNDNLLTCIYTTYIIMTETCEDCLELSANITTATLGDVIMIISSITQRPHGGISLLVNGSIARNVDFPCHTTSRVLGPEVIFHCTAWNHDN